MNEICVRTFYGYDLKNVLNLFSKYVKVAHERIKGYKRRLLWSYILSQPFSLIGQDTLRGSIAETNNQAIGAIFARRFPFSKIWIIGPVVVHPKFRGSGVATSLMNSIIEDLRRRKAKLAILSVETDNVQARRFFEKSQFEDMGAVFANHDQVRKYVQIFTLSFGYFQNARIKTKPLSNSVRTTSLNKKSGKNKEKTWRIMLREL